VPCGRRLNGGALSLSAARPSANTNIAHIRTYCTRPDSESGKVWRKLDFGNLGLALSYYVQVAATALCPRYAELVEANPNMARMVRWAVWGMPLWDGYEDELASKVADLQNASSSGFAGSVTAALFLRRFVPAGLPWLHLDLYGWNPKDRPGKPVGAWAHGARAVFELLQRRYAG